MNSRYQIDRMTPIKLYQGQWTLADELEASATFNGRVAVNVDGTVFGLVDDWHLPYDLPDDVIRLSYMSYCLDRYFVPAEVIARLRDGVYTGRFLFNAGGMGVAALWVETDDLERAFRELGLL